MRFQRISRPLWPPSSILALALFAILLVKAPSAVAQTAPQTPADDTIKQLTERLSAAEAKIQQLQSQIGAQGTPNKDATTPTPAATQAVAPTATPPAEPPPAEQTPPEPETHDHMMSIPGGPELHFRGFFDLDLDKGSVAQQLEYPLPVPATTSFRAGEFDLFMTSQLSDKLSFLTEFVTATSEANDFGVDLERFQLTYRPSKYFEISAGRFHTDFGYYNTAFHHGTWFSTATGRPFMYYFEDSGGPLPIHELGITTTGLVPGSGKWDLHWTAEIGDGSSEFGTPLYGDGVENFVSDRNHKDVNFAIYSKPEWLPGLQVGGSFLNGIMIPHDTQLKVNQNISSAYAVFINSKWEFMNEFVLMQHHLDGDRSWNSPMGYTQLAYRFGKYRPYFRFQEVNIPDSDPITNFKGRYEGPSAGIRMDLFDYAALKLQYNRVYLRNAATQNGIELQLAFTF